MTPPPGGPGSGGPPPGEPDPDDERTRDLRHALENAARALASHVGDAGEFAGKTVDAGAGAAGRFGRRAVPAWRVATEGETRWPVSAVVAVAIGLQLALPRRLSIHPFWVLPILEAVLMVALLIVSPQRLGKTPDALRIASIGLIAVISIGNAWSAGHLIRALIDGHAGQSAGPLLATGISIWLTNVIVFALWYWELDRGGLAARARAERPYPDMLFPQMSDPQLTPPGWEPTFWDYFYTSFTNATAFSPTDVMPLARWAKLTMLVQSAVSLAVVAMVIARAVNILK